MRRPSVHVLLALLITHLPVHAYLPVNCTQTHAQRDYSDSDVVIVGRVVGFVRKKGPVERYARIKGQFVSFVYFARIKVGRVLRGDLKVGNEINVFEGEYEQSADDNVSTVEDNTKPTWINQCGTHSRNGFQLNEVYLLFLNAHKTREGKAASSDRWNPRSCHQSIHRLALAPKKPAQEKQHEKEVDAELELVVLVSGKNREKSKVPFEDFIKTKRLEAEKAKTVEGR